MKQIISNQIAFTAAAADPSGSPAEAVVLSTALPEYTARRTKWLVTVTVSGGPATVTLWGALGREDQSDLTDDIWGKINDKYGDVVAGVLVTNQANGIQHYVVEDLGIYTAIYIQKSAGTVTGFISQVMETWVP